MSNQFVHLNVHSEFSLIDGIVRVDELVQSCVNKKMPAVAVTDYCNLFAAVKFYQKAISAGIKPILGAEILVANEEVPKQPYHVILLCQNKQGYLNLISLISKAYIQGLVDGVPLINREWLSIENEGLIAVLVSRQSDIGQLLLSDNEAQAKKQAAFWNKHFQHRLYLEITHTERLQEEVFIKLIVNFAHENKIPLVATNAVRFI
ncbi:MAG: PHP domain-containing protein, partial [Gammaproteobacteria bacterium]